MYWMTSIFGNSKPELFKDLESLKKELNKRITKSILYIADSKLPGWYVKPELHKTRNKWVLSHCGYNVAGYTFGKLKYDSLEEIKKRIKEECK